MAEPTRTVPAPQQFPYKYPTFRRVMLAAVKDGIFNPALPSLRRIDTDNAMHKLPDEHSQATTIYGEKEFKEMAERGFRKAKTCFAEEYAAAIAPPSQPINFQRDKDLPETSKVKFNLSDYQWSRYADTSVRFRLPRYDPKYYRFNNHVVRYIEQEPSCPTRFRLRQEPSLENDYDQKPTPSDIKFRYRQTSPQFRRNHISNRLWY